MAADDGELPGEPVSPHLREQQQPAAHVSQREAHPGPDTEGPLRQPQHLVLVRVQHRRDAFIPQGEQPDGHHLRARGKVRRLQEEDHPQALLSAIAMPLKDVVSKSSSSFGPRALDCREQSTKYEYIAQSLYACLAASDWYVIYLQDVRQAVIERYTDVMVHVFMFSRTCARDDGASAHHV